MDEIIMPFDICHFEVADTPFNIQGNERKERKGE